MTHQLEELPKNVQKLMCLYETENKYDGMYDIICASPFTPEEKATAIIQLIAQHDTELLNEVEEKLLSYRGAYIAAGGKRVDNMVHHSVIKEVIEQYQSKPKETV